MQIATLIISSAALVVSCATLSIVVMGAKKVDDEVAEMKSKMDKFKKAVQTLEIF